VVDDVAGHDRGVGQFCLGDRFRGSGLNRLCVGGAGEFDDVPRAFPPAVPREVDAALLDEGQVERLRGERAAGQHLAECAAVQYRAGKVGVRELSGEMRGLRLDLPQRRLTSDDPQLLEELAQPGGVPHVLRVHAISGRLQLAHLPLSRSVPVWPLPGPARPRPASFCP
jgi:hypothetical protein